MNTSADCSQRVQGLQRELRQLRQLLMEPTGSKSSPLKRAEPEAAAKRARAEEDWHPHPARAPLKVAFMRTISDGDPPGPTVHSSDFWQLQELQKHGQWHQQSVQLTNGRCLTHVLAIDEQRPASAQSFQILPDSCQHRIVKDDQSADKARSDIPQNLMVPFATLLQSH